MSVDGWEKGRTFSTSVSTSREYCLVRGESFPSSNNRIFEAQLFFWYVGLGEGHVSSRINETDFRRLGVS